VPVELQQQARAIGEPTRNRIFRHIAEADRPVTVAELTELVGLNHNAVRQHLAVLKDAGLVVEDIEHRNQPGRPRLLYRIDPEAAGAWGTHGPYEYLAFLLSEALGAGISPREAGRRAGRREAASVDADIDGLDAIESEMTQRGFRPIRTTRGTKTSFVLERCPFEDVAAANPEADCQLHLGLAEGFLEDADGLEVIRLTARNPHRAGCRLAINSPRRPAAAASR
jgi:predicted ArsR family transcriptional regulator